MQAHISIKIEPNGSTPPNATMTGISMNHFFSGIGLGTALTRHGLSDCPLILRPGMHHNEMATCRNWDKECLLDLPRTVPTKVSGKTTKSTIHVTATCAKRKIKCSFDQEFLNLCNLISIYHAAERNRS